MAGKKQVEIRTFRKVIEGSGGNIALIAERIGKSRSTVYRYLGNHPELKKAFSTEDATVEGRPHYPKEKFQAAIEGSNGIIQVVADNAGVNRGTVENALKRWPELSVMLKDAREGLVDRAESVIVQTLENVDEPQLQFQAGKYVAGTLGKGRGWTTRTELTGPDGEALFLIPADVQIALTVLKLDVDAVLGQFYDMVRTRAAQLEESSG